MASCSAGESDSDSESEPTLESELESELELVRVGAVYTSGHEWMSGFP